MENDKKKISCSYALLVIILFAVVCFLTCYIVIDRKLNENNGTVKDNNIVNENTGNNDSDELNNKEDFNLYSYDNIAGLYTNSYEFENEDGRRDFYAKLNLYNDGTFNYSESVYAYSSIMGNYIIKDNRIILNYLFRQGSDVGIYITNGTREIIIEDENTLIDNNSGGFEYGGIKKINLIKQSDVSDDTNLLKSAIINAQKENAIGPMLPIGE